MTEQKGAIDKVTIIQQVAYTPRGYVKTYGIIVNNVPTKVYSNVEEVCAFLRGLYGE